MTYQKSLLVALLVAALAATSCVPTRQNLHYFVLVPQTEPKTNFRMPLEDVKLAGYLDRHELTYLADNGELVRLPKAKWTQPLGTIVKQYLTTALRPEFVNDAEMAGYHTTLTLDQFFMTADGVFHVAGVCEQRNGKVTARKTFAFELPSQGPPTAETIVAQTRAALETLVEKASSSFR